MIGNSLTHYRITAKLREGGMGEVYRATDTKLGREVAIKVLPARFSRDAQSLARFEREAKALAALPRSFTTLRNSASKNISSASRAPIAIAPAASRRGTPGSPARRMSAARTKAANSLTSKWKRITAITLKCRPPTKSDSPTQSRSRRWAVSGTRPLTTTHSLKASFRTRTAWRRQE